MTTFARQLYFELLKLFARKRTYLGFGAFLIIEALILLGMHMPRNQYMLKDAIKDLGLDVSHYFSGLTVAFQTINYTVFLLGSLYLSLVSGDIVSKEVEDGTMRMILSRPVPRLRILILKYLACAFYTFALAIFIVASSLLLGIADRGVGGLFVADPFQHLLAFYETAPGLARFGLATLALGFSLLTLSSLGFMFSCFNMKPASATILTLSLYMGDSILHNVPFFRSIKDDFVTEQMTKWSQVFQPTIPWRQLAHSAGYLVILDLLFLACGALYFARRDFKS
jgi:ABC-2 type transport system permease protein